MRAGNEGTQERRARGFSHDNWRLNAKKTDGARERSPGREEGREDDHDPSRDDGGGGSARKQ